MEPTSEEVSSRLDPDFEHLLADHRIDDLDAHDGVVYGIFSDFRLGYLNPAWFRFAEENAGEPGITRSWALRRSVLDCVGGELREFLEQGYRWCLESGERWDYEYECSSASIFRIHHQVVYPLRRSEGLLVVNSPVVERPHDPERRPPIEADLATYADPNGLLTQCSGCRKLRNYRVAGRWDWVPEWVETPPPGVSHSFCPACFGHYFPAADLEEPVLGPS